MSISHARRHRDRIWETLLTVGIVWWAIQVPWQLEFGESRRIWWLIIENLLTLLFAADVWLRWQKRWAKQRPPPTNGALFEQPESAWWLLADVPAAIPLWWFGGPLWLIALRLTKLPRLVQMMRNWRRRDLRNAGRLRLIFFLFWMSLISHWIACGWSALRDRVPGDDDGLHYLRALYWTITTLATVGYGDITPDNATQMAYAIMTMMFGVGLFGYAIGNVAHMLANIDQVQAHYNASLDRLATFMRYRHIPLELQQRIYEYYSFLWERHLGYDEVLILSELPEPLRIEIAMAMKREFIEKVPFFQGASPQLIREIAVELRPVLIRPGEYVFRAGEIGRHIYFISAGTVEVISGDGQTVLATLTEGEFFGEIALLLHRPRSACVRAVDFCDLYSLDKATFERILAFFPDFSAHIQEEARRRQQSR